MHQVEGFVDAGQRPRVGDKRRKLDFAAHGVFHHAGQFRSAFDAAKGGAQPAATGHELERARTR